MVVKIVASSILILAVLVIRAVFRNKVNPVFLYPVWLVVALRLLLPGMILSSPISVMNTTIWDTGSRMIEGEYDRQETLYKQQRFQEYYDKKMAEIAADLQEEKSADRQTKAEEAENPGEEALAGNGGQGAEKIGNTENVEFIELKWQPAATLFGRISQLAHIVWIIGMVFFTLAFLWQNLSFYNYLRSTREKWTEYMAGRKKIAVFTAGDKLSSPCLFGLFPAIYIPASASHNPETLSMALEHEGVHYRHGDHIWALVRILCLIVNWYNPLVWVGARLSVRDGELACDEGCVRRLGDEKRCAYGEALIAMIRQTGGRQEPFQYATMMISGKRFMVRRIENIAKRRKGSKVSLTAMLIVLLFCAGCTYTGTEQRQEMGEASGTSDTANTSDADPALPAMQQENSNPDKGISGREEQIQCSGKAVVLRDGQEGLKGALEEKIFILTPENGQQEEGMNMTLFSTDLYMQDLEGAYRKLGEICRGYEKEEILKVLNKSFDLNLNEIEVLEYDALIQKVDEAGGVTVDVTEDEIDHINNYQLMMTGEEKLGDNEVTGSGPQILNGMQAAAYLQIRYFKSGYEGMMGRWKQVALELLEKDGVKTESCYEQFLADPGSAVYVEGEKENFLLCFNWEEEVKKMHQQLFSDAGYQPSEYVRRLDLSMKEQAGKVVSDNRDEGRKIAFLLGQYIGQSPFVVSLLKGESLDEETEKAWEGLKLYESSSSIKTDDETGRALYHVSLIFEESGVLGFPEKDEEKNPAIERFLYLVRREDGWYMDGPLHNDLPPENWWKGEEVSWESYDFGFSDEDDLGTVTESQEEYEAFMEAVREAIDAVP